MTAEALSFPGKHGGLIDRQEMAIPVDRSPAWR